MWNIWWSLHVHVYWRFDNVVNKDYHSTQTTYNDMLSGLHLTSANCIQIIKTMFAICKTLLTEMWLFGNGSWYIMFSCMVHNCTSTCSHFMAFVVHNQWRFEMENMKSKPNFVYGDRETHRWMCSHTIEIKTCLPMAKNNVWLSSQCRVRSGTVSFTQQPSLSRARRGVD